MVVTLKVRAEVGSLSCVGMVGASIGGGIGPYAGLHGLEVDGIKSVRMVTGRGDILDVSASSHSDLFWGIRGAGFNFGIITSATYNVYDFTNNGQLFNADFRIRASQNASVWEYLKQYEVTQPDNLAFELGIAYDQAYGGVRRSRFSPATAANLCNPDIHLGQCSLYWLHGRGYEISTAFDRPQACVPEPQ